MSAGYSSAFMYSSPMNWKGESTGSSRPGNLAYRTPRMSWTGPFTHPGMIPSPSPTKASVRGSAPSEFMPLAVS